MIQHLYSIKNDTAGFGPGIPCENDENAKQFFKQRMMMSQELRIVADQLSIWNLGVTYDTDTGTYIQNTKMMKEIERGDKYGYKEYSIQDSIQRTGTTL